MSPKTLESALGAYNGCLLNRWNRRRQENKELGTVGYVRIGIPEKDSEHIASAIKCATEKSLSVVFVSVSYRHILSHQEDLYKQFKFQVCDPSVWQRRSRLSSLIVVLTLIFQGDWLLLETLRNNRIPTLLRVLGRICHSRLCKQSFRQSIFLGENW